ncbi:RraA family protein [Spongiactinospora sp. 9N601]|uniref:RraA family protein n=1 Tax=Spongiactinospora sp. 9N601 TaxID=3375149 RepID=UPI0037A8F2CC
MDDKDDDKDMALLAGYEALDSTTISDALDAAGLPSGIGGMVPVWGHPKVVGFAATVELAPVTDQTAGTHIAASAVAAGGPGNVMVIANGGRTDVSCWGGLLSLGARLRGVRGVVADGACRDIRDARELAFPVYARGGVPATARGRLRQVSAGEPVRIDSVTVARGDVVVADESGVVFVPRARARDVLLAAQALDQRERAIADDLRAGVPLDAAMRDARLAGIEEH